MKSIPLFSLFFLLLTVFSVGCSSANNPVNPSDDVPDSMIVTSESGSGGIGLLGEYSVIVDPITLNVEMAPVRQSAIGEGFIVDGLSFFNIFPCGDCIGIDAAAATADAITLNFFVRHPFQQGNPANPPSGANRLDLDIFDPAIVVYPTFVAAQHFPLINQNVKAGFCVSPDGYTNEINNIYVFNSVSPYYLVVDDNAAGTNTFNKFAMGDYQEVEVYLTPSTTLLYFNLYLTMGYGASATFQNRLTPKYFNPEFNRKAAWKVRVTPLGSWIDNDNINETYVQVDVCDWQQGATVFSGPGEFSEAPVDNIFSQSDVAEVLVEIPGMMIAPMTANVPIGGSGTPADPLIYLIPIKNETLLTAGDYTGIVKVRDGRIPESVPEPPRDCIVYSPDGKSLGKYVIPEYATYQTFVARVIPH